MEMQHHRSVGAYAYSTQPQKQQQQQHNLMYQHLVNSQPHGQPVAPRQLPPYVFGSHKNSSANNVDNDNVSTKDTDKNESISNQEKGWAGMPLTPQNDNDRPNDIQQNQTQHVKNIHGDDQGDEKTQNDAAAPQPQGGQEHTDVPTTASSVDGDASAVQQTSLTASVTETGDLQHRLQTHRIVQKEKTPCAFFLKTGSCAYGDRCKFEHPYEQAPKVMFNSVGLPLRPSEPPCTFYMKTFRCAFGHTCKYNHPEPTASQLPTATALSSPSQYYQPQLNSLQYLSPMHHHYPMPMAAASMSHLQGGAPPPGSMLTQQMAAMNLYGGGMSGGRVGGGQQQGMPRQNGHGRGFGGRFQQQHMSGGSVRQTMYVSGGKKDY